MEDTPQEIPLNDEPNLPQVLRGDGMSLPACPECNRAFNRNELARRRHDEIMRLWARQKSASQIAQLVGLSHADAVLWHIDGKCKCEQAKGG